MHIEIKPARKIIKRGHRSFVGLSPTRKSSKPLAFESTLERDFLYILEASPEASDIRSQPTVLRYFDGLVWRKHVPDYSYLECSDLVYVEVKPLNKVTPQIRQRAHILARQLAGIAQYRLLTEEDIRAQPRLRNAVVLHDGLGHDPDPSLRREILRLLTDASGPLSIEELRVALAEPPTFVYRVFSLILDGEVRLANPMAAADRHALVTSNLRGDHNA